MNLLLDLGNSRLKWGLSDGKARPLLAREAVAYDAREFERLTATWRDAAVAHVCYASVVDGNREQAVLACLPSTMTLHRFEVSRQFDTLHNDYGTPETLGLDRWAAAIGAWTKVQSACLVISAGTATTIDLIEVAADGGHYRGGLILPGVDLMLQSLHQGTARLPLAAGSYRTAPDVPDNTEDAMVSGAIEATCGAIDRMASRIPKGSPWLLTGGGAPRLCDALGQRVSIFEDLVLEGLAQI